MAQAMSAIGVVVAGRGFVKSTALASGVTRSCSGPIIPRLLSTEHQGAVKENRPNNAGRRLALASPRRPASPSGDPADESGFRTWCSARTWSNTQDGDRNERLWLPQWI